MNLIAVEGGRRLGGELTVQSAKNGVLPVLAAAILCREPCLIRRCPRLSDVDTAVRILRHLGAQARWEGEDLLIDARELTRCDVPEELMRRMRSSVIFLGAILARCGRAEMSYPGGCELGPRPIDLHLSALRALGAEIREEAGTLRCEAPRLTSFCRCRASARRKTPSSPPAARTAQPRSQTPRASRRSPICSCFCRKRACVLRARAVRRSRYAGDCPAGAVSTAVSATASRRLLTSRRRLPPAGRFSCAGWTTATFPP